MTRKKKAAKKVSVETYKHESATRKNIPTAKIAAEGVVPRVGKAKYAYSAHLSPELRFDASGRSERVSEIVETAAAGNKLTKEEAEILRGLAAYANQPWLEWSGKKEEHDRGMLEVEPVALHIHERVSANAIIRSARREDLQSDLFADPRQEYREAVQFYKHDVDWANRIVLGDSLEVMSSLTERENMTGKVQMIYMDPPYGIKFASNFQSEISKRDVQEKDNFLTREPEMIKAYRDTWRLGLHSYLSYMRDRLLVARKLLSESGSIFVQISDENLHRVKLIMDDVFGAENYVRLISFQKTGSSSDELLGDMFDYILWYAKCRDKVKYRQLNLVRDKTTGMDRYDRIDSAGKPYRLVSVQSDGDRTGSSGMPFDFEGRTFSPNKGSHWSVTLGGMKRLALAGRISCTGKSLQYRKFHDDFPLVPLTANWRGVMIGKGKQYVVQTSEAVVGRCVLMTTDPGDIVLDPTCGSGTTAFVAEKWGRRWITIDSSRVAISIARQRLLTALFECYEVNGSAKVDENSASFLGIDPSADFVYKTSPHITLGSIASNDNLDPIIEKYAPILARKLSLVNEALESVDDDIRRSLVEKLASKLQEEGLRSVSDDDRKEYLLPGTIKEQIQSAFTGKKKLKNTHVDKAFSIVPEEPYFEAWQVPQSANDDWPEILSKAVDDYQGSIQKKFSEIEACIRANAEQEVLYDAPTIVGDAVRVSGPFTVEGVRPEELSLDERGDLFDPTPNEWEVNDGQGEYSQNASAYLDRMLQLVMQDGVTFPNNEHRIFALVERVEDSDSALHAEALWEGAADANVPNVAIAFGPQHGPVTASQVEDLIRASRRYDELVIAAFSFDGSSQAVIQESANPRLKIHMAHIRPDISPGMDGLLKDSPKSQLFTVFGQPEIGLHKADCECQVELLGVDIYSPLTGEITSSGANKVAAWFLDSDYDGRCFCIAQAFFPNQKAWDKIAKALGSSADAKAFEAYNGTISVPFEPGEHQCIAVKVIDPRGNEVMAIRSLAELS